MIVADTNLIAYLLLTGHRTRQAEAAFGRDPMWAAPLLWRSEFRNILAHYCRRGSLAWSQYVQVCDKAERLVQGQEYAVASAPVLALSAESRCSAYDCEFVALAQDLDVPVVTSDRVILKEFPSIAVSLDTFAD